MSKMTLLPPAKDACQICAVKHRSNEPHNRDSLFYQMRFRMAHDRDPLWADAIAHCTCGIQLLWKLELKNRGVWVKPVEGVIAEPGGAK